jgi:heme/copper-type cytochrome/quinol oxidase subunit 2
MEQYNIKSKTSYGKRWRKYTLMQKSKQTNKQINEVMMMMMMMMMIIIIIIVISLTQI